jgi:serine protease inhibitor
MDLERALLERLGDGDVVFSPHGLRRALEVVRRGASGRARAALDEVLGPEPAADVAVDDPAVILYMATAAWLAAGYEAGPALAGVDAGPLDASAINAWARERTRGMIPSVVDRLARDEILALTDVVYLDAAWRDPFDPAQTRPRPFAGAGDVPMMDGSGEFSYAEADGLQAVRLPYGEGALHFVGVLGDGDWRALSFRRRPGRVELPRFSAESSLSLEDHLQALGLGPAFEPGRDLDGLVTGPDEVGLSRVLQRARADVDERGTKAAAVTVVTAFAASAMREPLPPFHIVFDRPFTWAVEHAQTGAVLFLGRVHRPTERSD